MCKRRYREVEEHVTDATESDRNPQNQDIGQRCGDSLAITLMIVCAKSYSATLAFVLYGECNVALVKLTKDE